MSNVVRFYKRDAAIDPNVVLERAIGQYESVVVLGYDKDGELDARASINIKASDILWIIESFKAKLLAGEYCDEEDV